MRIAEAIDLGGAERRAHRDAAELGLQRFEQGFAELGAGGDGQVGIARDVLEAIDGGDFRIEEVAHEKALGQADAAKGFKSTDAARLLHGKSSEMTGRRTVFG